LAAATSVFSNTGFIAQRLSGNKSSRAVLAVKNMIESRYREPLEYDDFCAEVRLSRCHLCNIFSQAVGMPPAAYLNHVRLEAATALLSCGNKNIAEIACDCGISDANYFSRIFRKRYGIPPSQYGQRDTLG